MRIAVPLPDSYRLINHGPTTLITSRYGERTNVMAAAWVMALDFDPPKLAAVIAQDTFSRELVDASKELVVSLPTVAMKDITLTVGRTSGRDFPPGHDKLAAFGLKAVPAQVVGAPLIDGCAAWLECKVIENPALAQSYDLFICEVVAAWADDRVFRDGTWHFEEHPELRTLHHLARGVFFATGERLEAHKLPPR